MDDPYVEITGSRDNHCEGCGRDWYGRDALCPDCENPFGGETVGELDGDERTFDEIVTLAIETALPARWNDPEYAGLGVADRCRAIARDAGALAQEARDRLVDLAEQAEAISEDLPDDIHDREEDANSMVDEVVVELERIESELYSIHLRIGRLKDFLARH